MPATMNAANEIAVDAFLNGGIRFTEIAEVIRNTMDAHTPKDRDPLWRTHWRPIGGPEKKRSLWSMPSPVETSF